MTNLDNIRQMNSEELATKLSQKGMCAFCRDDRPCISADNCYENIKLWLEAEATPTLTDDEKVILRNIDKDYKWIYRMETGSLYIQSVEPYMDKTGGYLLQGKFAILQVYNHLFKFIEKNEPYEISKLLGE